LTSGVPSSFCTGAIQDTVTDPFPAGAGDGAVAVAVAVSSSSEPLQLAIDKHMAKQSNAFRATLISLPIPLMSGRTISRDRKTQQRVANHRRDFVTRLTPAGRARESSVTKQLMVNTDSRAGLRLII
jgi:hypothetical protein